MNKKSLLQTLITTVILSATAISCGQMQPLYDLVQSNGFIPYPSPLSNGATGILLGGTAAKPSYLSSPTECFPNSFIDPSYVNPTDGSHKRLLRDPSQATAIPVVNTTTSINGNNTVSLLNLIKNSTGSSGGVVSVGASFNTLGTVSVAIVNPTVENIDDVAARRYYELSVAMNAVTNPPDGYMDQDCQDYLNVVGYVAQALRFESLRFTFENKSGAQINLNTGDISPYFSLNFTDQFSRDAQGSLIVNVPMYIGYQLRSLRAVDQGFSLNSASTVNIFGQFEFKSLDNLPHGLAVNTGFAIVPSPAARPPHVGKLNKHVLDKNADDIANNSTGLQKAK